MANKHADKRCPRCGNDIDSLGSCRVCGRQWSSELEEEESVLGPDGQPLPEDTDPDTIKPYDPFKKKPAKKTKKIGYQKRDTFTDSLPDSFKLWAINPDADSDTEIVRKRSLMRLESGKIYNQMGLSVRAQETQRNVLIWITRLWEFLDESDREILAPTVASLKVGMEVLNDLRKAKVARAAAMEKQLTKEHRSALKARLVALEKKRTEAAKAKTATKVTQPGQDSEGFSVPQPVALDPNVLKQQLIENLGAKPEPKIENPEQDEKS
jgi:hypothetical protein